MKLSVIADTGLTAYLQIRNSSDQIWNGSAFEAYASGHIANYKLACAEQGASGFYDADVPAAILAGNYTAFFFSQSGGSPAESDTKLGASNFVVPTTTPTISLPSDLISSLRILAHDTTTSNYITRETLFPKPDGTMTKFRLGFQNIVSGSVYITQGSGPSNFRVQTGFTIDGVNGILTFSVAPINGLSPFEADYNYEWFTDTDYSEFLTEAAKSLGQSDPNLVDTGLREVLLQYALGHQWLRRSAQYATRYASSGGQAAQSIEVVTKNFLALAATAFKLADKMRDDFYKKQSRQLSPASAIGSYGIDPFTPQR